MTVRSRRPFVAPLAAAPLAAALLTAALLFAACASSPSPNDSSAASIASAPSASATSAGGSVIPAPGSESELYAPNPGALLVAIDPGHGGCLDWGVPDPLRRGAAYAEKTMTLAIASELQHLLEAQGIGVLLTRTGDEALAGDAYPELGCNGPPWRDVNGDGESGFHPDDPEGAVRTRDELQARLDLANVARADVLVSIHINSLTQDGVVFEIAATETFYTDETAWGEALTERLARLIQHGVVAAMAEVAGYERQDRGTNAHNLFIVAPPLLEPTPERPDPRKQPTRGALMPSVLTEVGSITLKAEQDLLASARGQAAAAAGIYAALVDYFAERPWAVRYAVPDVEGPIGSVPQPVDGDGPPLWIPDLPLAADELTVVLTNTGTEAWPTDLALLAGWAESEQPYLRLPPDRLEALPVSVPPLEPGASVELRLPLPLDAQTAGNARQVIWITLALPDGSFADLGSPPLQLARPAR